MCHALRQGISLFFSFIDIQHWKGDGVQIRGGGGAGAEKYNDPRSNQQYANYWAPLMRKQHHKEHGLQRPSGSVDPTQHAKGRTGDCPGPRKENATRRNVTQGVGGLVRYSCCHVEQCSQNKT